MRRVEFDPEDFNEVARIAQEHPGDGRIVREKAWAVASARLAEMLAECPRAFGDKTVNGYWYFCEDHQGPYPADTHQCRLVDIEPLAHVEDSYKFRQAEATAHEKERRR